MTKHKQKQHVTNSTHRYYRGVIVPAIREHCGYETDAETHRAIKAAFYEMHPDDPKLPSMGGMSQDEASRYLEFALHKAAELSLVIPDPCHGLGVSEDDVPTIWAASQAREGM